jgi:hypothetical protein
VHTAKFANEAEVEHVRQAVLRERIEHPVVVDEKFDVWKRYAVRSWPTLMLISPDGRILAQLQGEGQRAVLDVMVEQALEMYERRGAFSAEALPLRLERTREIPRELCFPRKVLADPSRALLFIADSGHHRIVVTDLEGRFVRQIGSGEAGLLDGPADEARFHGRRASPSPTAR